MDRLWLERFARKERAYWHCQFWPRSTAAFFGGGLSFIVLAVLALEVQDSLTKLNALKQMISLCANVAAAILFLFSNKVIWSAAIVMAIGALLGESSEDWRQTGSTFRATWHCHSIRGGSRRCIFFPIENCEWQMPLDAHDCRASGRGSPGARRRYQRLLHWSRLLARSKR